MRIAYFFLPLFLPPTGFFFGESRGQTGGLLATFDVATGSTTVVWREPPPAAGVDYQLAGQAEWSPDGTHLIFNQVRSRHLYWNLANPVPNGMRAAGKKPGE